VLAEVVQGEVVSRRTLGLEIHDEDEFVERLLELRAGLLVCGGIPRELLRDLTDNGIEVIYNVAGEVDDVLDVLRGGRLSPGYGLRGISRLPEESPPAPAVAVQASPVVDCLACPGRACARGEACSGSYPRVPVPRLGSRSERCLAVGMDVSAESDPRLCRIAELIHFILGMDIRRVGLAYCWELFGEIEMLVPVLSRHFTVVPVCCRVGTNGDGSPAATRGTSDCRPDLQAALLQEAKTEINVMAGLCIGCDMVFAERSHVPVTALFVRDRVLAHNPMAALHTRYYLDQIGSRARGPAEAEDR
jgi:uncharacterized metal-binding protein/predicted Fe-Mo cluster-binding NifX family protein